MCRQCPLVEINAWQQHRIQLEPRRGSSPRNRRTGRSISANSLSAISHPSPILLGGLVSWNLYYRIPRVSRFGETFHVQHEDRNLIDRKLTALVIANSGYPGK